MSRMFAFMSAVVTVQGSVGMFVVYGELLKVVGFLSRCEVLCVVYLYSGCDGYCAFCLTCDACNCKCFCMGRMLVYHPPPFPYYLSPLLPFLPAFLPPLFSLLPLHFFLNILLFLPVIPFYPSFPAKPSFFLIPTPSYFLTLHYFLPLYSFLSHFPLYSVLYPSFPSYSFIPYYRSFSSTPSFLVRHLPFLYLFLSSHFFALFSLSY